MKKQSLKVQPALKVYKPKYPSFEDKNPLLYPETRPYPFTHRFINWVSTGGLASFMLFSGGELKGQSKTDSLYNPFLIENAGVPYQPVSFGTGMPERLKSEEAVAAIRKAFKESEIELENNVWLNDEVGVFLDGYSQKDEIGFVFVDYGNMDGTFVRDRRPKEYRLAKPKKGKYNLKIELQNSQKYVRREFERFLEDKDKFIKQLKGRKPRKLELTFAENLSKLAPFNESETEFNTFYLQRTLNNQRERAKNHTKSVKEIFEYIDNRFEDSSEKMALLNFSNDYVFGKGKYNSDELYEKVIEEFRKLKTIKSDKKFIKNFIKLKRFYQYNNSSYLLSKDPSYQILKLNIMKSYPLKKWLNNVEKLDEYHDKKYISLPEARLLDRKSKNGSQFIAPIFYRDPLMVLPHNHYFYSDELSEEQGNLRKEFNDKNGMTEDVLQNKHEERQAVYDKYPWSMTSGLSREKRDSINSLRNNEIEKVDKKYKAMELLTDEERAEFKVKFDELEGRRQQWAKENQDAVKMKALRKLEEEVKIYIKWAKSQMGG